MSPPAVSPATLQHLFPYAAAGRLRRGDAFGADGTRPPRRDSQVHATPRNKSAIENGWNQYKAAARQQWSKLSEAQLDGTMGRREQLSSRLQEAYSLSEEDAERQISEWQEKQVEKQAPAARN